MSCRGRWVISTRWRPCCLSSPACSLRQRQRAKRRREMQPARRPLSTDTVRQAVAHTVAACVRLLHERTILVLLLLFCLGMGCMLWYVSRLQSNLIASIALQDASLYAQALAEFCTLYTSWVSAIMWSNSAANT